MPAIRVAVLGVGNCASALLQGIAVAKAEERPLTGLNYENIGGYGAKDIDFVLGFDVDARKVNVSLAEAIFALPNCCWPIAKSKGELAALPTNKVLMGPVFDGVAQHMLSAPKDEGFCLSSEVPLTKQEIVFETLPSVTNSSTQSNSLSSKLSLLQTVDTWSYRIIGLGFPFLTIGIISGAVWANEAWGSYWSWDPKETWALITWLVFAIYLHARLIKGWQGKKAALVGTCGFFVIWICYLGVNFLGKGLHSYGWVI